jgi:hypothetical protein
MLLALTLWVSSAVPLAEVPRPVALKDAAVQVLLLDPALTVSIDPGGGQKIVPAARGMLLLESDKIVVGSGAWVALVILGNGHVVRLDDDVSLKVSELALLRASKQSRSVVDQLDALLTKKENEHTERLIGWHASMTAANTQPVQKDKEKSESGGGRSKPNVMAEERMRQKDEEPSAPKASAPLAQPSPPPPPPPPGSPVLGPRPAELQAGPAPGGTPGIDPELQRCVDGALAAWGDSVKAKLGGHLTVSAKLRNDELIVSLSLGLPPSPCFETWFRARGNLSATWTRVTVPLP